MNRVFNTHLMHLLEQWFAAHNTPVHPGLKTEKARLKALIVEDLIKHNSTYGDEDHKAIEAEHTFQVLISLFSKRGE